MSDSVAQDQLCAFVGRIEGLEATIRDLNSDKSEVYKEAKGNGFDIKVLRKVIADRRKDYSERVEFETIYDLYMAALGHPGMVNATGARTTHAYHDPITGEVHEDDTDQSRNGETGSDSLDSVVGTPSASTGSDQTGNLSPETATSTDGGLATPIGISPASYCEGATADAITGGENVATPHDTRIETAMAPDPGFGLRADAEALGRDVEVVSPILKFGDAKPLRPHCLTPNNCAGQGRQHCWNCRKASGEAA